MLILHLILGFFELYIIVNINRVRSYHTFFVLAGFFTHAYFMYSDNINNEFSSNEMIFVILYFIYLMYLTKKVIDTKENVSIKIPLLIVALIILINAIYYIL
ncbi:hypothetical protein ACN2EN_00410 [Aliarcobacter lanthieri]|uniref:hypothetical protein n=2 Tax=Aliarcobacter lanthieri TaxID=1355374 RepID=UPI00047921D3|nr:hypothetical protein [Aliarcobacter lanthieri]